MQKYKRIFIAFLLFTLLAGIHSVSMAQPPPPAVGHGASSNQPAGEGAPVGDGIFLLIGLAGLYGAKKVYDTRTALPIEDNQQQDYRECKPGRGIYDGLVDIPGTRTIHRTNC
jgi:hypothetical protein